MAKEEIKQKSLATIEKLSFDEIDSKIKLRGIDHKRDKRINEVIPIYERKIPRLEEELLAIAEAKAMPDKFPDVNITPELEFATIEKLARIKEKYACCLKELDYRKDKAVTRQFHDTVYYIDLDAGNDGDTGLATGNAWLTIEKYTTTTVRTAGDIAWVRANTSEVIAATVNFDEDGTQNALIEIRGCSSAAGEDPWGDASDVKPIFDFNAAANYFYNFEDLFWRYYRMDITNSTINSSGYGALSFRATTGCEVDSCDIHGNTVCGFAMREQPPTAATWNNISRHTIKNCNFYDNGTYSVQVYSVNMGVIKFFDCVFNGGAATTNYGIAGSSSGGDFWLRNCTFGVTTAHDNSSLGAIATVAWHCQACKFGDATIYSGLPYYFLSEDHNQVFGASYMIGMGGSVERSAATQIDALDSILMTPRSICGPNYTLEANRDFHLGAYRLWVTSGAHTISIKARETAAWAGDPDATGFRFEATYVSGAATGVRTKAVSTESLNGVNEVTFNIAVNPAVDSWVYVNPILADYEAGKTVNASILPVVT